MAEGRESESVKVEGQVGRPPELEPVCVSGPVTEQVENVFIERDDAGKIVRSHVADAHGRVGPTGEGMIEWRHPARASMFVERSPDGAIARVYANPPRSKVAIVGFAQSSRAEAPVNDPTFEVWGLNQLYRWLKRADRWFEIHTKAMYEADMVRDSNYVEWLRKCPIPLYMERAQPDMPMSITYPADQLAEHFGRDYFTSSPAYMVILAIAEGFKEIHIYGIDLVIGREYQQEKPCMEYWLARAEAMGIKVVIPERGALLKQRMRYGTAADPKYGPFTRGLLERRVKYFEQRREEYLTTLNNIDGALIEAKWHLDLMDVWERGAEYADPLDPSRTAQGT